MSIEKTDSYFKAVNILFNFGFKPFESFKKNKTIKNSLTKRVINSEYSFFEHKNESIVIMRQIHQDKNGSAWMKSDFFIKELLSWVDDLQLDYAFLFYSGTYFEKHDVVHYINHLINTYKNNKKICIFGLSNINESLSTKL